MGNLSNVDARSFFNHYPDSPYIDGNYPSSSRPSGSYDVPFGANRTSGVAPLGVVFTGGFNESSGSDRDFHDHFFLWSFGDSSSGTWGTNGKSRNIDTGPVAAHVFETPGTYNVQLSVIDPATQTTVRTESVEITVTDPDVVFSGANTICVNNVGDTDFTGKPTGAVEVNNDDIKDAIDTYKADDTRILFKRGGSWDSPTSQIAFTNLSTVHIGAYGTGTSPDAQGLYSNAPLITDLVGRDTFSLDRADDLRIADLQFSGAGVGGGNNGIKNHLELNLKFSNVLAGSAMGWSYYRYNDTDYCDGCVIANTKTDENDSQSFFGNGERLALIGNTFKNSDTSHVSRVQQMYIGVYKHNVVSGSSLLNTNGRHALKMHGPKENTVGTFAETGNTGLRNRTRFAVIADNLIGSSGTWPLAVGPQDSGSDERCFDILVERNKYLMEYGDTSTTGVAVAMKLWASYVTARNNIIDGTGGSNDFRGIEFSVRGVEPAHVGVEAYCNVIVNYDTLPNGGYGFTVGSGIVGAVIKNNIISFPNITTSATGDISDSGTSTDATNNLLSDTPGLVDPENVTPLSRDYSLDVGSIAIDYGTDVPVYDDYSGTQRTGTFDAGAFSG